MYQTKNLEDKGNPQPCALSCGEPSLDEVKDLGLYVDCPNNNVCVAEHWGISIIEKQHLWQSRKRNYLGYMDQEAWRSGKGELIAGPAPTRVTQLASMTHILNELLTYYFISQSLMLMSVSFSIYLQGTVNFLSLHIHTGRIPQQAWYEGWSGINGTQILQKWKCRGPQ